MLTLTNIKRTNEYIEANYIPEHSDEQGFVRVDLKTEDIIESVKTSYDEVMDWYLGHARYRLAKIVDWEEYPEKLVVMWY